jgi:MarR family transcriptional repressor of emrRAB
MGHQQIEMVEAGLRSLGLRIGDVPIDEVLVMRLVQFIAHDIASMLDQHIRPHGLGEGEFRALTMLYAQPNGLAHPTDLCMRASQSPANMSRICDALVSRGLITRGPCAEDRRKMVLHMTAKGDALVQELLPGMFTSIRALFGECTAEDRSRLTLVLKGLVVRLDEVLHRGDALRSTVERDSVERN